MYSIGVDFHEAYSHMTVLDAQGQRGGMNGWPKPVMGRRAMIGSMSQLSERP